MDIPYRLTGVCSDTFDTPIIYQRHVLLINEKFKDYESIYRGIDDTPFSYLLKRWYRYLDSDFWIFLLNHYQYHIHGHDKYYQLKEQRALNKIKKNIF